MTEQRAHVRKSHRSRGARGIASIVGEAEKCAGDGPGEDTGAC